MRTPSRPAHGWLIGRRHGPVVTTTTTPAPLSASQALARLHDPAVPALPTLLTTPHALLAAAVDAAGGRLDSAHPRQASWVPGRSLTVRYDAQVRWATAPPAQESLVATIGRVPRGALVLTGPDGSAVGVWRAPHDPSLPGLARLGVPEVLAALLDDVGVPAGTATSRTVAYRPGRRAVVRVERGGVTVFLKVVRPSRIEALHRRHQALRTDLPVPHSLGWSPELGVVVQEGLSGRVLRAELCSGAPLPSARQLVVLLDRLPAPPDGAVSRGWGTRDHVQLLASLRPDLASTIAYVADAASEAEAEVADTSPLVPVHGDFHEAQLLVRDGRVTGVLDVDTAALGDRVQDLATMIGHLSSLALRSPQRRAIERYAAGLLHVFDRLVDPVTLRHAVAAVVLGLATGPFRVLEDSWPANTGERIALAAEWTRSAERVAARAGARESALTARSSPSHV